MGNLGSGDKVDYRLTRFGAYLVAMAGDDTKPAVAQARVYFAVRAREAELGALTAAEIRDTALARAREMVDYRVFRDMMAENAPDYAPSSKATQNFFATIQNRLYLQITGMTAEKIRSARPLATWPGREEGKAEPSAKSAVRKVAKNYLTARELGKLDRLVGRLCLTAMDIAEDGDHLSLPQWRMLVDAELAAVNRQLAA
ncbi:RhuM family protein [Streptomyces sp. NPDC047097]|uniref:RhuM family protein n=1 Tax=Streptomyces sp. NPDC047097 TaxID=3155260 RepID=UPI0033C97110